MAFTGRSTRRKAQPACWVLAVALCLVGHAAWSALAFSAQVQSPQLHSAGASKPRQHSLVARAASVVDSVKNPIKTVADTIDDFYKAYPQPPVLPMYRTFVVDLMTQLHLARVDSRFKYDVIFALGLKDSFDSVMGNYDKLVQSEQSAKIWTAMVNALDMNPDTVVADATEAIEYAKSTTPAEIMKQMEAGSASGKVGEAFTSIKSSLYSQPFSVGLFKVMELSGVDVSKANAEEWAKSLGITPSKVTSDLETYKLNKNKLQKAEEMIREIEIREKKKLAERLEAKAKALAEKAKAAKPAEES